MPRLLTFSISYYQLDVYQKKIITAGITADLFDSDTTNTAYQLDIDFHALDWLELILQFAFEIYIFMILFVALGGLTIAITAASWFTVRSTTTLQNPPELRISAMLALIVPPAFAGTFLGVAPIWLLTSIGSKLVHLLTHLLTYSFTDSLTHSLTHVLTYSLTHSLIYSLTNSLTHSLTLQVIT